MTVAKTITGENKVKFGIKNVHYAIGTEGLAGALEYGSPVPWPGAKSISLEALGEITKFYADDVVFFQASSSGGYEGELEMTNIPDQMRIDVFGETLDDKGVLMENTAAKTKTIALLFEVEGDKKNNRFVYYNVALGKPALESESTEEEVEPGVDKVSFTASPDVEGNIRAKSTFDTDAETFNNWFKTVYKVAPAL